MHATSSFRALASNTSVIQCYICTLYKNTETRTIYILSAPHISIICMDKRMSILSNRGVDTYLYLRKITNTRSGIQCMDQITTIMWILMHLHLRQNQIHHYQIITPFILCLEDYISKVFLDQISHSTIIQGLVALASSGGPQRP